MKKFQDNILTWCENPEEGAIIQARKIAEHPWLVGNVCLMPDIHEGYGVPYARYSRRLWCAYWWGCCIR